MKNSNNKIIKIVQKIAYSWPAILISVVVFFPVAYFLLYKRYTYDKTAVRKNFAGLRSSLIGISIVALIIFILILGDKMDIYSKILINTIFILPCIIFSVGLFFLDRKSKLYNKYILVIVDQKQTSIKNIASAMNLKYEKVSNDLQDMVDGGILKDAYIDIYNQEIVIKKVSTNINSNVAAEAEKKPANVQTKAVTCKNCGASNKYIVGEVNECEYCGSCL